MKLRDALRVSRYFYADGKKLFALMYIKEQYWTDKPFAVYAVAHPYPGDSYQVSSEMEVKPVIRQ